MCNCASLHSGAELLQSHTTGNEMMMMVAILVMMLMVMMMVVVVMLIITMMIKLNKILPTFFTEDSRRNLPEAIHVAHCFTFFFLKILIAQWIKAIVPLFGDILINSQFGPKSPFSAVSKLIRWSCGSH